MLPHTDIEYFSYKFDYTFLNILKDHLIWKKQITHVIL